MQDGTVDLALLTNLSDFFSAPIYSLQCLKIITFLSVVNMLKFRASIFRVPLFIPVICLLTEYFIIVSIEV